MLTAEHLIECQRELLDRSRHNANFRELILDIATEFHPSGKQQSVPTLQRSVVDLLARVNQDAYVYQVTADMTPLLAHAAASLDESDVMDRDLSPTRCGLVRLETPLVIQDYAGGKAPLHWILWGQCELVRADPNRPPALGTVLYLFQDRLDSLAEFDREMARSSPLPDDWHEISDQMLGRWFSLGVEFLPNGLSCGPELVPPDPEIYEQAVARGDTVVGGTNLQRVILALWLLLQQTIVTHTDAPIDRTRRKMAKRAGIPGKVTVITLRKHAGTRSEGETHVEWSHRWIVRGHWRWQPYGPGRTERRRIWIAPFIKGPDDAPLITSDKVYRLSR